MKYRILSLLLAAGALLGCMGGAAVAQTSRSGNLVIYPKKTNPNQLISFSFQQADIDDVLKFLADATGKIIFKDSSVSTTITIRNQSQIPVSQALKLVEMVLALKGYSMIETDDALIVTTQAGAQRRGTNVTVGKELSTIPEGKGIITHIFPLSTADAVHLKDELTPLFPAGAGTLIADGDTNSLIVIDEADNVRRVARIIEKLDRPLTDELSYEVVRLQYADATEMARYLTDLFKQDDATQNRPGAAPQPAFPFPPGGQGSRPGSAAPTGGSSTLAQLRGRVRFAADARSNSIIVFASPSNIKQIKELIAQLDVNLAPRTEYRIIELKYADATALADQINRLLDPGASASRPTGGFGGFGGFGGGPFGGGGGAPGAQGQRTAQGFIEYRVVPDIRTNALVVTAPIDAIANLEKLVRQLDKPSQVQDVVRTFQLKNAIASEVATTLRNLFLGTNQGGGLGFALFGGGTRSQIQPGSPLDLLRQVVIVPNDQTNTLLFSGPSQTFPVIEDLLREDGPIDRRLPQVFIEVIIADVTLDQQLKFGIEWTATAGNGVFGQTFGLTSPTADNTGFRYSILSKNFQATLHALKEQDKVRIVSTPHVMVTDNSPALISIGENIPYAGSTTITNGVAQTSTAFQDVAITLNVTPHISPGNHILMDIDQVINSLIQFVEIAPGQTAPRTTSRRAGTTVIVQDNQTVVLGGIISNNKNSTVSKVPILGDIPLIGQLFRNTVKSDQRTELVVFITPHVVRDPSDADPLRDYERSRLRVDPLKEMDAPFARPLDITPADLKQRRKQATERSTVPTGK